VTAVSRSVLATWPGETATPPAGRRDHQWILQPLVDAGLEVEEIRAVLLRVACAGIDGLHDLDVSVLDVVADRPAPVRAAWLETVHRMITCPAR
jgi:hypothetical protein